MSFSGGQEKLANAMLKPINPAMIVLLGVFTIVWGFWVGNPFWDVFPHATLYSAMVFMSEGSWGLIATAAGIIICHGAFTRKVGALILGAATGGVFWMVVSLMFFIGDWMNTGGITALTISIYCACIYLNLKVNCKHMDKHKDDLFV